jgi:hypothetical protein
MSTAALAARATTAPASAGARAMYPPSRYMQAIFGGNGLKERVAASRWREPLSQEKGEKAPHADGVWVRGDVVTPERSEAAGMTVAEACQAAGTFKPPKGWAGYDESRRRKWRLNTARERHFQQFCADHPNLSPSSRATYAAYGEFDRDWLTRHELTAARSTMCEARRALCERRQIPKRGKPKGVGRKQWHARAEELFDKLYMNQHRPFASDVLRTIRAFAHREKFAAPTYAMVLRKIRETPWAEKVLTREGEQAYRAKCEPKGMRPRERTRKWWSLDCRTPDVWLKVPDGRGIRAARLCCSGIYIPFAQKWADLRAGFTENKDLIAGSVKHAAHGDGLPAVIQTDRGWAYAFLSDDDPNGIPGLLQQFGVEVTRAEPYSGWQKPVEGAWNTVKRRLDRFMRAFCGGSIPERPEDLEAWAKAHVWELPTFGQYDECLHSVMEELNATPRPGLGNLTPNLFMDRYWGTFYRPTSETLDVYCNSIVGRRKCARDGVRFGNHLYRPEPTELPKVQNRKVVLRRDPDRADTLILCDDAGLAICDAYCDALFGLHRETAREHARRTARYRATVKRAVSARNYLRECNTAQLLAVNRELAKVEEARVMQGLGDAPEPAVRIIRPELADSAKGITAKRQKRDARLAAQRSARPRKGIAAGSNAAQEGFELLAETDSREPRAEAEAPVISAAELYGDVPIAGEDAVRNEGLSDYYGEAAG